jgi:hypothetical protein
MADGRGEETEKERLDRNLIELLNELRVALPGVQVLFAFLLTVPFTQRFATLTSTQEKVYYATLLLTTASTVLLIAALPTQLEAAAALAVFAPMSVASMALLTGVFAWVLTRPIVEPVYRTVLIPALGVFALMFGAWYTGIT